MINTEDGTYQLHSRFCSQMSGREIVLPVPASPLVLLAIFHRRQSNGEQNKDSIQTSPFGIGRCKLTKSSQIKDPEKDPGMTGATRILIIVKKIKIKKAKQKRVIDRAYQTGRAARCSMSVYGIYGIFCQLAGM